MKKFFRWLKTQSPNDERPEFQDFQVLWEKSSEIDLPFPQPSEQGWEALHRSMKDCEGQVRKSISWYPIIGWAGAMLLAVLGFLGFVYKTEIKTGPGDQTLMTLSDKSEVILSPGTRVSYGLFFGALHRNISLSGEAYFKVQKDTLPFRVHTVMGTVTVLGTEFNVSTFKDRLEVGVNRGSVQVDINFGGQGHQPILMKGDLLHFGMQDYSLTIENLNPEFYPAWNHQQLLVQNEPLFQVCEELERRFDIEIKFPAEDRNRLITGRFQAIDGPDTLESIAILLNLNVEAVGGVYQLK